MKVIVLKNNLKNGLSAVEHGVSDNNGLPILKNVLIKSANNKIDFLTTNLDLAIKKTIAAKVTQEGSFTIPFNTFYGIINNTAHDKVSLEKQENYFTVKTDNYEAKIQGLREEDFPTIPTLEMKDGVKVNVNLFKKAIGKIINCAQISEIRPEISGVLFDYQVTCIKLVATDSFRLAEKTLSGKEFESKINHGFKAIIPLKTIQEVVRIFDNEDVLEIYFDENQVLFKTTDLELISRLIDGNYPDYEQILPKSFEVEMSLDKEHFVNAVKLICAFSLKNFDINLALKDQKTMSVYLASHGVGENNYLIPVKAKGNDFENVVFNGKYLLDGLKIIDSENLVFGVNGGVKPALIKSQDDASCFYILMPVRN